MDYAPFWSFWKRCSGKSCWMRRGRCNWRFSSLASHATHKRSWKTKQTKKILKNVNVKKEGWGCVIVSHPRVILMNSPRRVWRTHLITDRHRYIHPNSNVYRPVTLIRGHLERIQNLTRITPREIPRPTTPDHHRSTPFTVLLLLRLSACIDGYTFVFGSNDPRSLSVTSGFSFDEALPVPCLCGTNPIVFFSFLMIISIFCFVFFRHPAAHLLSFWKGLDPINGKLNSANWRELLYPSQLLIFLDFYKFQFPVLFIYKYYYYYFIPVDWMLHEQKSAVIYRPVLLL